ncbi:MAG TPA: DNA mismatch repair endonuclease MutL, partial [Thermoanaerobaculia bacterium]|nr:DNA mismatch repair endonuclease MutL [Thermoanaerobaculia bacterium]
KIANEEDLPRVRTLGFRGEALPSIASVARLTLTTSDGSGPEGTRVAIDHGGEKTVAPAARPRGTDVRVEDLFARTPARRKFLKTPEAEAREIARAVTRAALARPDVAFTLRSNGRELIAAPPAVDRAARAIRLFGAETLGALLPFEARSGSLTLSGFVTRGSVTFPTRRFQFLHVNGRSVSDRGVSRAIAEAAREAIRTDRHPGAFLYLDVPEGAVDVNVSPAKTEVRFAQPSEVFRLVFHTLLSSLAAGKEERRLVPVPPPADFSVAEARGVYAAPPENRPGTGRRLRLEIESPGETSTVVEIEASGRPTARVLAQFDESFLVVEAESGLWIVDQHAAHERVIYERMKDRASQNRAFSQALLTPALWEASAEEALAVGEVREELAQLGFDVEERSGNVFAISGVPPELAGRDAAALLREVLEPSAGERDPGRRRDRLMATVACRSAVTIHHRLAPAESDRLLQDWLKCRDRFTCPHGRPVVLSLSDGDLLTFFRRR